MEHSRDIGSYNVNNTEEVTHNGWRAIRAVNGREISDQPNVPAEQDQKRSDLLRHPDDFRSNPTISTESTDLSYIDITPDPSSRGRQTTILTSEVRLESYGPDGEPRTRYKLTTNQWNEGGKRLVEIRNAADKPPLFKHKDPNHMTKSRNTTAGQALKDASSRGKNVGELGNISEGAREKYDKYILAHRQHVNNHKARKKAKKRQAENQ